TVRIGGAVERGGVGRDAAGRQRGGARRDRYAWRAEGHVAAVNDAYNVARHGSIVIGAASDQAAECSGERNRADAIAETHWRGGGAIAGVSSPLEITDGGIPVRNSRSVQSGRIGCHRRGGHRRGRGKGASADRGH